GSGRPAAGRPPLGGKRQLRAAVPRGSGADPYGPRCARALCCPPPASQPARAPPRRSARTQRSPGARAAAWVANAARGGARETPDSGTNAPISQPNGSCVNGAAIITGNAADRIAAQSRTLPPRTGERHKTRLPPRQCLRGRLQKPEPTTAGSGLVLLEPRIDRLVRRRRSRKRAMAMLSRFQAKPLANACQ